MVASNLGGWTLVIYDLVHMADCGVNDTFPHTLGRPERHSTIRVKPSVYYIPISHDGERLLFHGVLGRWGVLACNTFLPFFRSATLAA